MKTTNVIIIFLIIGAAAFFSGIKFRDYQPSKNGVNFNDSQNTPFRQGRGKMMLNGQDGKNLRLGGALMGEIISIDDNTMTVKTEDGGSKIIVLSDITTFAKSSDGKKEDLKTGEKVAIFGTNNSDGSVTAQNVQINPNIKRFDLQGGNQPENQ